MSGPRPGRHHPWRTRHDNPHPHPVAVRRAGRDRYEVMLSTGAGVADLVAAAATLPHDATYTTHHPATFEHPDAAVLVFHKPPADPGGLAGVPARPCPPGEPPPPPGHLSTDAGTDFGTDPAGGVPAAAEHALARLATPAAASTHAPHPTPTHRDQEAPPAAPDAACHEEQAAA